MLELLYLSFVLLFFFASCGFVWGSQRLMEE
jgi:hypothetical protein